jgi:hypothetical protein
VGDSEKSLLWFSLKQRDRQFRCCCYAETSDDDEGLLGLLGLQEYLRTHAAHGHSYSFNFLILDFFFIYFFNHFAKSYDCVKIYQIWQSTVVATTFMTKLSWRTAVGGRPRRLATAHGGWEVKTLWATSARPNRRDPRRLGPF